MASAAKFSTTLSTKGQLVLPKAVRDSKRWKVGTKLVIEERDEGVLIKAARPDKTYTADDLVGILKYDGPPISIEEMNEAGPAMAAERYLRSRG